MPQLFLNDSHFHYGLGTCHKINCLIKFDGQVACLFPCHQEAQCIGDFTDWPYDTQMCAVVFRTFLTHEDVKFDADELAGSMAPDGNKRWKIIEAKVKIDPNENDNVKFVFVIQRCSEAIFLSVYIPGYVLIALTLSVLWMKHGSFMRSAICGAVIYLIFSLMDRVWWQ